MMICGDGIRAIVKPTSPPNALAITAVTTMIAIFRGVSRSAWAAPAIDG